MGAVANGCGGYWVRWLFGCSGYWVRWLLSTWPYRDLRGHGNRGLWSRLLCMWLYMYVAIRPPTHIRVYVCTYVCGWLCGDFRVRDMWGGDIGKGGRGPRARRYPALWRAIAVVSGSAMLGCCAIWVVCEGFEWFGWFAWFLGSWGGFWVVSGFS